MDIEIESERIKLQREQWKGNCAYISNYPGLLDKVQEYTIHGPIQKESIRT